LLRAISRWIRTLRDYLRMTGGDRISRRYFVINSFDGLVTILGVIVGALASGAADPRLILGIGGGSAIAMVISGFSGTLMAEIAEIEVDIERIKRAMLVESLDNTIYERMFKVTAIWASLVNAASPGLAALAALTPQILAIYGLIDPLAAVTYSIATIFGLLFVLGAYLARVTRRNPLVEGAILLLVGIVTTLVIAAVVPLLRA